MNRESAARLLAGLGDVTEALVSEYPENFSRHRAHLNPYLAWISRLIGLNVRWVKAEGSSLYDARGDRYLDFMAGFGALNLGHEPPEVIQALREVEGYPNFFQSYLNPLAGKLAEYLVALTGKKLSRVFFCNSGTEACEAALKLARASSGKERLIYTRGAYHGKTMGALSVSGRDKYKKPFGPLVPGAEEVPFDDPGALEEKLKQGRAAAFIVEPVQGEGGVIVPAAGYLKKVRELCDYYGVCLIVDEVQTGMGRTGKFFCFEHDAIMPDVLVLSKALGGGVMPLGAIVAREALWRKAYGSLEKGLLHTSTFGGNTRACACGIAAVRAVLAGDLAARARETGEFILGKLAGLQGRFNILREVRGKGLLIGLSFARLKGKGPLVEGALTTWIVRRLIKRHRVISAFTLNNYDVLRIAPPLNVSREDAEYFLDAMEEVLTSAQKFARFRLVVDEGPKGKG